MCGFTQGEGMCVMGMRNAELRTTELRRADMHMRTCGHKKTVDKSRQYNKISRV